MSIQKRIASFGYAFKGLADLFRSQPNARIHALATILICTAGICCGISRNEWLVILTFIALVIALEAVNTSVEYLTDLVSPDYHPLAGKAKDAAAAAVLIAAIGAVIAGILIFLPHVSAAFHG